MLSRVANALFWNSRYTERAEITSRVVAATYAYSEELQGISPEAAAACWTSLPGILDFQLDPGDPEVALHTALFDPFSPGSVINSVIQARENARSVRDTIPSEYWEATNVLFHLLNDSGKAAPDEEHDMAVASQASQMFHHLHGLRDNAMLRDDGWNFMQIGRYLERAAGAVRAVDYMFKHPALVEAEQQHLSLDAVHLATTLRMCMGYEAFFRGGAQLAPEPVADFLLLNPDFPRAAEFSIQQLSIALHALSKTPADVYSTEAEKLAGRLLAELRFMSPEELFQNDLHAWLIDILKRLNALGVALHGQYFY